MPQEPGLKSTTIGLMGGVALLFDTLQVLFSWIGMGILLIPLQYGVFILWFRMHGLSFLSLKRMPSLAGGAIIEAITAGIFPAFTAIVLRAALTSKLKQVAPGSDIINEKK